VRHCSELAISRHVDGRQGLAAKRALRSHLSTCGRCVALLEDIAVLRSALKELAQMPVPASLLPPENPRARLPEGRHLNW
jgi:anti-sigma factor RsiW